MEITHFSILPQVKNIVKVLYFKAGKILLHRTGDVQSLSPLLRSPSIGVYARTFLYISQFHLLSGKTHFVYLAFFIGIRNTRFGAGLGKDKRGAEYLLIFNAYF